jgi:hypothetical protein
MPGNSDGGGVENINGRRGPMITMRLLRLGTNSEVDWGHRAATSMDMFPATERKSGCADGYADMPWEKRHPAAEVSKIKSPSELVSSLAGMALESSQRTTVTSPLTAEENKATHIIQK